jgi:hypothetical protein
MIRKSQLVLLVTLGLAQAGAQQADDYRGGWRTDGGEAHTYEFSIHGDQVAASTARTVRMPRRWLSSTVRSDPPGFASLSRTSIPTEPRHTAIRRLHASITLA